MVENAPELEPGFVRGNILRQYRDREYLPMPFHEGYAEGYVVTIDLPDVGAPLEETAGPRLGPERRQGSLFGAHPGSVRVREGVDLLALALDAEPIAYDPQPLAFNVPRRRC